MYEITLFIHSWLRWAVILLTMIVLFKSIYGYVSKTRYDKTDNNLMIFLVASAHTQLILGLLLYFVLSPISSAGMSDFPSAMKNPALRYWTVEHGLGMILFVLFVQIARTSSKKTIDPVMKFKKQMIYLGISMFILTINSPWPQRQEGIARHYFMDFPKSLR
ncbi:MAG: hypothetical protein K2X39_04810 [Silvanigrellaceae bacterium]|nr:hypothetical protein [Silvanigrellaceae bacterium]